MDGLRIQAAIRPLTSYIISRIYACVSPRTRKLYSFWIEPAQADALKQLKARDGIPESEQIRRALDAWIAAQELTKKKTAPRRVPPRRKA